MILSVLLAKGYPGLQYMIHELVATTLWEDRANFKPKEMPFPVRSLSHPFHCGFDAWFYMGLGGIQPTVEYPGFKRFNLRPVFVKQLNWVKVDYECDYGMIRSHWKRSGETIEWRVTVPPNTSATVQLPALNSVRLNGRVVPRAKAGASKVVTFTIKAEAHFIETR